MGSDPYGINIPINLSGESGKVIKEVLSRSHAILSKYPEAFGIDPMNTVAVMELVHRNVLSPADERNILIFTNMFSTQRVVDLVAKCRGRVREIERLKNEVVRLSESEKDVIGGAEDDICPEIFPVRATVH